MRYYVTADTHGFFSILIATLTDMGFFNDPEPHKLVICGDLLTAVKRRWSCRNL